MAQADSRRRGTQLKNARSLSDTIPPELAIKTLVADILLPLSLCSAKYWLLVRGVGSLWLSINVLAGGGIGALAYLAIRGRVAVRGDLPWKLLLSVGGLVFAQQIALFYSLKRLNSSRIVFIAPFCYALIQQVVKTHSVRYIIGLTLAVIVAAMVDSKLATENGTATFKAYIALLFYGSLQVVSTTASAHLANSFETVEVTKALTVLSAAALTIPIHLLGRTIGLLPPYPYVPLLALTPLPLLAFVLLFYYPHIITSGLAYSPRSVFQLAYIPTAVMTCILSPLFSRQIAISDAPLAILLFYAQRPSSNLGPGGTRMQKSASEPFLRLLQGYINTILSNPESRKIFYFLIVNLAYMFVQLLYGVWTNSLGLISDAIHMAFDCMAIAMGLFASVMATWKPNERFTYGYSRIETLSGFANGIFLVLISVFIIVEAIQRLIDPPEMNTRQLLLVSTVGLGVNLFGMFAMGGHHHHGHSHSHGGHSHGGHSNDDHSGHSHATSTHHSHEHSECSDHAHDSAHQSSHSHSHSHSDHSHDHSQDHSHGHDHSHSHSHNSSGHSHTEEHSHSHSNDHNGHSHSHSRSSGTHFPSTPDIRLESPTDEHFVMLDPPTAPSSTLLTPITPSSVPFTPITPSYSFTYDAHLQDHHPEIAHSHDHSASHEGHSHNMRGVFLHVMADTLGSVGVILSTILINIYGWTGFDPIASMFIAVLIAASVVPLVIDTGKVLALDLGGKEGDVERALQEVSGITGVQSYTEARFWPLEQSRLVGSIHIQVAPGFIGVESHGHSHGHFHGPSKLDRIRENVEHVLKSKIKGLDELVVQIDG